MNKKFKKIITTSLLTLATTSAIGCASPNSKIANKINNGMNDFISSINKLDYVDTNQAQSTLGKIVSATNSVKYFADNPSVSNIEDSITKPADRSDNFKLYVLSDLPYISFSSDENGSQLNLSMNFSTDTIETTSNDISEKINKLILKRAILMIYVNEIYAGNVNLTEDNRTAINAYVNVIKENASFLNGNRGMVKNQLGLASDLINNENNNNLVNYYIIKSGEALEIRANKIDSTISAIDSIISILEQNLTSSSCYYQNNLTNTYNNIINNLKNNDTTNENNKLANSIADSINFNNISNNNKDNSSTNNSNQDNNQTNNNQNNSNTENNVQPAITNTQNSNQINNTYPNLTNSNNQNYNNKNNENNKTTNTNNTNQNANSSNNTTDTAVQSHHHRRHNQPSKNNTSNNLSYNPTVKPEPLDSTKNNQNHSYTNINNNDNNSATRVPYKASPISFTK